MSRLEAIKNHFESEAKEFDSRVLKIIPYYSEMLAALIVAIPFVEDSTFEAIDLGSGTGTVAKRLKEKFPKAKVTCLDFSEKMLQMAQAKLQNFSDVTYQAANFSEFEFEPKYDLVISSLALHHLESDQAKKDFFRKIYQALKPNGIFYNADVVLAASEKLQTKYMEKWTAFTARNLSEAEVQNNLVRYKNEDMPAKLNDQLTWLTEVGFKDVEVIWKYYNFAVYGGVK